MNTNSILPHVNRPSRYLGNEFNITKKQRNENDVTFALLFPDLYEIGMSHFGLQILYHIINQQDGLFAERCFCPDIDAEKIMLERSITLESLETATPINTFDILGITLPYELCYTNILTAFTLAGIPFYSHQRDNSHPLVLGGGSCALNPEPVADFFDAILLGDGEEAVIEIGNCIAKAKRNSLSRDKILTELSTLEGVYIPSHFTPIYDQQGCIKRIEAQKKDLRTVKRRILTNLDRTEHLMEPIVPNARIVHDRLGIEIARGCTRGCRFCQAGMTYRPVRERSIDQLIDIAEKGISSSGFDELALLSLSTGDYSCIDTLLPQLMDRFSDNYVSVSVPSMRVGTLSHPVMEQIKRVRKTGFTVAPEAGSERLREVINKGITEEDLLSTCHDAFSLGWNAIKLYFMIGLPTETEEDLLAISELTNKTKNAGPPGARKKQITVSVGTFVPKPHTPFQWEEQISIEESRRRIATLRNSMPRKGAKLKYHDPETSFLEGVFSRGDRKLAELIVSAWEAGARFDGWSDHFNFSLWQEAAMKLNIDFTFYLRARDRDEIMPWQHLSSGVDQSFLKEELEKAHTRTYTPDCRYHGCQKCGLCDFKTLFPVVHQNENQEESVPKQLDSKQTDHSEQNHFKYFVTYSKKGNLRFLGHLEILQILFRALRRGKIETHYSKGFNPSPKISFGGALPVGMESETEYFIMDLPAPLNNTDKTIETLNKNLPVGLLINTVSLHSGKVPQNVINHFEVLFPFPLSPSHEHAITEFLKSTTRIIQRERKGRLRDFDIRPLIKDIVLSDQNLLRISIESCTGSPTIKAQEAVEHILSIENKTLLDCRFKKVSWEEIKD